MWCCRKKALRSLMETFRGKQAKSTKAFQRLGSKPQRHFLSCERSRAQGGGTVCKQGAPAQHAKTSLVKAGELVSRQADRQRKAKERKVSSHWA